MDEKLREKLTPIFDSEEIMRKISMSESLEEMQTIFAENGVDFSIEEVKAFVKFMNAAVSNDLSEVDLDQVAGGVVGPLDIFGWAWKGIQKIAGPCWQAGRWFAKQGW